MKRDLSVTYKGARVASVRKFSNQGVVNRIRSDRERQIDYRDAKERGLGLRVSPGGTKSFYVSYRFNGRQVRRTIGTHPYLTLDAARKQARGILASVDQGRDPAAEDLKRGRGSRVLEFGQAVEEYLQKHAFRQTKNARETKRLLERYFVPTWRNLRLPDIDRALIKHECEAIVSRGAPGSANNAFAALRAMMNWCVREDLCPSTPCSGLQMPASIKSRDRVLKDHEISAIVRAAKDMGGPYGAIVQLLFLTGQRMSEVSGIRVSEVDRDNAIWEIPADRNKPSRRHRVPLVPTALALLFPNETVESPLFFAARGRRERAVSGFSKWKGKLDCQSEVTKWRHHDIRRTVATRLAEMGVQPHVIGSILNHADAVAGPTRIYVRHDYFIEAARALRNWEQEFLRILEQREPNKQGWIARPAPLPTKEHVANVMSRFEVTNFIVNAANANG